MSNLERVSTLGRRNKEGNTKRRRALPISSPEQDPTERGGWGGGKSSVLREHEQRNGHQRGNGAGLIMSDI